MSHRSSVADPPEARASIMDAKAFLVQDNPTLDFSPLREHAAWPPVVIFPPGQVTLSPDAAVARAREKLAVYRPGDFLVLIGDPIAISICVMVAVERAGVANVLRWDRREKIYLPVTIKL